MFNSVKSLADIELKISVIELYLNVNPIFDMQHAIVQYLYGILVVIKIYQYTLLNVYLSKICSPIYLISTYFIVNIKLTQYSGRT